MNAWTPVAPCTPPPVLEPIIGTLTLYYIATAQQSSFPLSTSDRFGNAWTLRPGDMVTVFAGGQRLMPDDGTGEGDYTLMGNVVTLFNPAGLGEHVSIDIWSPSLAAQAAPIPASNVVVENVPVIGPGLLHPLSAIPTAFIFLIINGRVFSTADSPRSFYVSGPNVVWTSPLFSFTLTDQVIAFYGGVIDTSGPPPVLVDTLYYAATSGQLALPVASLDMFGNSWSVMPTTIAVYASGSRLRLDDGSGNVGDFTVSGSLILLVNPAGAGEQFVVDSSVTGSTLYYAATAGQTAFPLGTTDLFGNSFSTQPATVKVFAGGARLTLSNDYTLGGNTVTLINPAGAGQSIVIDGASS